LAAVRKLKERIKRSTTKQNNLDPVWNETFEVLVEVSDGITANVDCFRSAFVKGSFFLPFSVGK
jgi:Ca2+-dependent lipid-binding protein